MKKAFLNTLPCSAWFYACLFFIATNTLFASCKKESTASATPGVLTSSATKFEKPTDNITFTWTVSTVKNSNTALGLFLQVDKKGNNFSSPANVYLTRESLAKTFTGVEFNDVLTKQLKLTVGSASDIEVRLKSVSSDGTVETFYTNAVSVNVKAFNPPPYSKLWMVGDATPNGWNIDNPNPMTQSAADPFVFIYEGNLKAGEFKIPTTTKNWGTDYYMPLTNHQDITVTGVQLVKGGNPDFKWQIITAGTYKVMLNTFSNTIEIKKQ